MKIPIRYRGESSLVNAKKKTINLIAQLPKYDDVVSFRLPHIFFTHIDYKTTRFSLVARV